MTVSNTASSVTLPGNGVLTVFDYNFEIPYQDDGSTPAVIIYTTTAGVNTTLDTSQYSISGVGNPAGGTVTYTGGGTPLPAGSTITIARAKDITQPFAFPNNSLLPKTIEAALDNLCLEMQQLKALVSAGPAIVLVTGDTTIGVAPEVFVGVTTTSAITITLPAAAANTVGMKVYVKDVSGGAGTFNITVNVSGGGTIDAYTTFVIGIRYQSATFISDGIQWLNI